MGLKAVSVSRMSFYFYIDMLLLSPSHGTQCRVHIITQPFTLWVEIWQVGGRANNMNQNQQFTLISLRNILLGDGDRDMICDVRAFLFIFKKVKCKIRIVYEKDFMRFYK